MMKTTFLRVFKLAFFLCLLGFPLSVGAQISDDFSARELDPAAWRFVDPMADCSYEVINGLLTLSIPASSPHDPRGDLQSTPRLMQDVTDGDFEIEAKFQSIPAEDYQVQGLLVVSGPTNFLRLDFYSDRPDLKVSCATVTAGVTKSQGDFNLISAGDLWLRLSRSENTWRGYHSVDGETWTEAFVFDHVMTVSSVGVFGGNAGVDYEDPDQDVDNPVGDKRYDGLPAPAFAAVVDYFFDTADPIDPEDGDIQNGVRVADDLQALYYFRAGAGDVVFDYAPALPKLDLAIADTSTVTWLPGGGLDLASASLISSAGPAEKINTACVAGGEITMEAWVDPVTTNQSGPARILTVSADPSYRNATLAHGQWGSLPTTVFDVRLRTTETSLNGQPETISPTGSLTGDLQHVVYTRDAGGTARIYVDGDLAVTTAIDGTLDNWDGSYRMAIGAEMDGTRHWLGTIHLAAIYSRALTPGDVEVNFGAGPYGGILPESPPVVTLYGLTPGDEFFFSDTVTLTAVANDLDGTVVHVEFFADDVVLGADSTAPYAFAWTNPTVGGHQIRAVATDDQGNQAVSDVIPIQVTVPESFRSAWFLSDDFHDTDLGQPWTVTDGTAGATVDQSGGHVIVDLPAETQDPWTVGAQTFFAHQSENDVDIALELKLATVDFSGDAFGGLRFEGAGGEVVQLLGEKTGASWTVSWGTSDELGSLSMSDVTDGLWLQVRRQDGGWTCLYSKNGANWQQAATLSRTMTLDRCGWVAGGLDAAAGAQAAAFDYAFNLAAPIHPEDGGTGGDYTGPVIGDIAVDAGLDQAALAWQTDEPSFYRVAYGLTTGYELGLQQGSTFLTDHAVDITGLDPGSHYHFQVTCVDTAGNFTSTEDMMIHTDLEAVVSDGPAAGDVYRETRRAIYTRDAWRVTDPDALNPGAWEFLPNPVLNLEVPDLTGAVRAEMIIDRWGGHPGTSNKMIRISGRSWLHLPEMAAIPSSTPECYMYEDNLMLDIPLDQLAAGTVTLEGTADRQICNSFNWGQWGWYGVVLRVYYDGSAAHPTGSIMSPVAGETIVDAVDITVDASSAGAVEEVQVLAYYEGLDTDGDGVFAEWQREYFRLKSDTSIAIGGIVGVMTAAPYEVNWDVEWIPDQQPGSVKLQARILDDTGMWYVTDFVENLSLGHSDAVVKMYSMDSLPPAFWVRDGKSMSAEFTIPAEDDLATATEARMVVSTWNGIDSGKIDINGLWQATSFGVSYFYSLDEFSLSLSALNNGVNTLTISATSPEHGMEVNWPGPMFFVRYGSGPAPSSAVAVTGDVNSDGAVDLTDARLVLEHCVEATRLTPTQATLGDVSEDGRLDPWDAALISETVAGKADPAGPGTSSPSTVAWGQARGLYGKLTLPLEAAGGSARSVWLEVTAPGIENLVEDVSSDLADAGLFRWKASGDKLWIAFAGSEPVELSGRMLEIVMNTSGTESGSDLRANLAIDGGVAFTLKSTDLASVPVRFRLGDNYPNPFNPVTNISFDLPVSSRVLLRIYDVRGNEIRTLVSGVIPFGSHTVNWNGVDNRGRSVPSGVYFYRIETPGFAATHKMMLVK